MTQKHISKSLARWSTRVIIILIMLLGFTTIFDRLASTSASNSYPAPGNFVSVNGQQMHYICQGEGKPTLVLVAGFGGDVLDWTPIMDNLAKHSQVCAFDRLGQGWSDPIIDASHLGQAAEDLHTALTVLGIEEPIVVGHSLGGAIVQIYAAQYPVRGVVLVDGLSLDVAEPVVARMGTYQSLTAFAQLGLLRPLGFMLPNTDYEADLLREMRAIRSRSSNIIQMAIEGQAAATTGVEELQEAEAALNVPMLIIAADKSNVVPGAEPGSFAEALRALADRYSQAEFHLITDAHHYVQAQYPNEVSSLITTFVANHFDS